jgi:uncharacterized membrane protein YhaH (DUF805 family)
MSPWSVLEWVTSVSLSVVVIVGLVIGIALVVRRLTDRSDLDG